MLRSLSTWFLAGALAASLSWNWRLARPSPTTAKADGTTECVPLDFGVLQLAREQEGALDALCRSACVTAEQLDSSAEEKERVLMERLAREELSEPAARALVAEITELRRQSLEECVKGILGVRRVLSKEQVERLLLQCQSGCIPK